MENINELEILEKGLYNTKIEIIQSFYTFENACNQFKKLEGKYVKEHSKTKSPLCTYYIYFNKILVTNNKLKLNYVCFTINDNMYDDIILNHIDFTYDNTDNSIRNIFGRLNDMYVITKKEFDCVIKNRIKCALNGLNIDIKE
jgi:hypothetical protein